MKKKFPLVKKLLVPAKEWRKVHPFGIECESDLYYAQLASDLATSIKKSISGALDIHDDDYKDIGINIAAYLEDKVSGLNIWNSFISLYKKEYGNGYPFYDIEGEEMFDDEPNFSDIRFLLWNGINFALSDNYLNPLSSPIEVLAEDIFGILEEEYEIAPESPEFRNYIYDSGKYDDVIEIREMCEWIVSSSYLFASRKIEEHFEDIFEKFSPVLEGVDDFMSTYIFMQYFVMDTTSGPLDLHPWKYLAEMLELSGEKKLVGKAPAVREIKTYDMLPYLVLSKDDDGLKVMNVAGDEMTVSYDALTHEKANDVDPGDVIMTALFFCNGEWNINGGSSIIKKPAKNEFEKNIERFRQTREQQKLNKEYYLKKNSGSPIGIAPDYDAFCKKFGLDAVPDKSDKKLKENMKSAKGMVYFVNDDGTMTILQDAAYFVKLPGNTFYDETKATEESALLILGDLISDEMRQYLIDNNLIPDARLSGDLPDDLAKSWFKKYASFINRNCHSDKIHYNLPQ